MSLEGLEKLLGNITGAQRRFERATVEAAREVGDYLEGYAKTHTGTTARPGKWITVPGAVKRTRNRGRSSTAPGGWIYPKGTARRWRGPGVGWGDVTGLTRKTIRGRVRRGAGVVYVVLSANTPYAPMLELAHGRKWQWLGPAVTTNKGRIVSIINRRLRAK